LRQGWKPVRGETPVPRWLDAQRDSPAPRSGETPRPTMTWQTKARMPTTPKRRQPTPIQCTQRGKRSTSPLQTGKRVVGNSELQHAFLASASVA
jgi:hypothetical protein